MKYKKQATSRRYFLKQAGKGIAAILAAGSFPAILPARNAFANTDTVNFAYIRSDHHAPIMVIANNQELFREKFSMYLKPVSRGQWYDFYDNDTRLARIKLVPTKKGPDVQNLVAQGDVDMAISGTQAILMSADKGVDTRIVSPIQTAGNVFVLKRDLTMGTWEDFVKNVKGSGSRFRIGIPGPHTVAAIIFRSALDYEGISYKEDNNAKRADIEFVNMKGHGNLVTALGNDIAQGIIGAQPYPAVTIDRGMGKLILNLQKVPPHGRWMDHACCSLEAKESFLKRDHRLSSKLVELLAAGVRVTNENEDLAAKACSEWLGVDHGVEEIAMRSLNYTNRPTVQWKESVYTYVEMMDQMGVFKNRLKGRRGKEIDPVAFDFDILNKME